MAYDDRFKAVLIEDLQHVCEKALDKQIKRTSIPALAELAEALCPTPNNGQADYYGEAVEAALHRAISRVGADKRANAKERREGFTELLGIGEHKGGQVMRRRDDVAPKFGRRSGEALRKAEGLLFDELAGHLLALAKEHDFFYSALLSYSTFYPDRPVYDYNSLSYNYGRYGAIDSGPVFNSFINTPSYGDERTFFDGRRSDRPPSTTYDPVRDVTKGSKVVILRIYVDNMAYVDPDDPHRSTALGARVRVRLPTATAPVLRARGYILADNADVVEDTVDLLGTEPFRLIYVPNSAVLLRDNREYGLSDSIVEDEGALIGHTVMDGVFPAGNQFEYAAFVMLKVRAVPQSAASIVSNPEI